MAAAALPLRPAAAEGPPGAQAGGGHAQRAHLVPPVLRGGPAGLRLRGRHGQGLLLIPISSRESITSSIARGLFFIAVHNFTELQQQESLNKNKRGEVLKRELRQDVIAGCNSL